MTAKKTRVADRVSKVSHDENTVKCLSFFSGAMGLDLGLEKAGITTLLASEIDESCRQTIVKNRPAIGLIGDCRDYSRESVLEAAGLSAADEVELMAGGPPCQAFSTAGRRRGFEDQRGNVFLHYIKLILDIRPRIALIENVRGILSAPLEHIPWKDRSAATLLNRNKPGGALSVILDILSEGGYSVTFMLYNAANFGAPQIRERVIFLCSRDGKQIPYLTPTHSENGEFDLPKWRALKDVIAGMRESEQIYVKFPEKRLKWYRMLKSGQNWRSLPQEFQKEALGRAFEAGGGKTGFLRRLAWDKPSPTLVTSPSMPATDLAHPEKNRPLSVQEYKRIQEFPDDWEICGSIADQYRQIGNAVPVSLGCAAGKTALAVLKGEKNREYKNFKYSRYINTDDRNWRSGILKMKQASLLESGSSRY